MKRIALAILVIVSLYGLTNAQVNSNIGNLSSVFNDNFGELFVADIGIRAYDDNGTSYLGGSVSLLQKFSIGFEYGNFNGSDNTEMLLLSVKYKIQDNLILGSFLNNETRRYGLFGIYSNQLSNINYALSGGFDLNRSDYYFAIDNPIPLSESIFLSNKILISSGEILADKELNMLLVSTGAGYTFYDNLTLIGNFGFNLLKDFSYPSFQFNLSYKL